MLLCFFLYRNNNSYYLIWIRFIWYWLKNENICKLYTMGKWILKKGTTARCLVSGILTPTTRKRIDLSSFTLKMIKNQYVLFSYFMAYKSECTSILKCDTTWFSFRTWQRPAICSLHHSAASWTVASGISCVTTSSMCTALMTRPNPYIAHTVMVGLNVKSYMINWYECLDFINGSKA